MSNLDMMRWNIELSHNEVEIMILNHNADKLLMQLRTEYAKVMGLG